MAIKAVLFDLGGTLIKTASPPEIVRRILARYGQIKPIEDIALAHEKAERSMAPEDYSLSYYDFWVKWNRIILGALNIRDDNNFLAKALVDEWWDNADVELYPDAGETLRELEKMGLKIGIVTNAFKKDIEEMLKRVNLPAAFDVAVGIDAVGKPKPDPEIFMFAVRALNVKPEETIFVGDSLEKDYFGALNAGLKAILLDREDNVKREDLVKIKNLRDLIDLLKKHFL
ncbi:MAG: HAD family hydrolase [Candidatus Bathyarchaeia archaeon]